MAHPPLRTNLSRRGNLPRRPGGLIGRDDDLVVIAQTLAASPVVTLVGPGGIGKTRLAVAAARLAEEDLADGAWLIELAAVAASGEVPRSVADILAIKESPTRTVTQSVVAALQSRHMVLVLDNCEHVIDGAAALAHAIAQDPLAIELAAARITSLTPADLLERLDDRLRLLTGDRRTSVERHRTLRATIQWSNDLLTPREQALFHRLSIFVGPLRPARGRHGDHAAGPPRCRCR